MEITAVGNMTWKAFIGTGTQAQEGSGMLRLPPDYAEGTDIYPVLFWSPNNTNAGNFRCVFDYNVSNYNGTYPADVQEIVLQAGGGVARTGKAMEFSAISGAGITEGARIHFRIYRNPANADDTMGCNANILSMAFFYLKDTTGSRSKLTK
jgi:hypothetical protein